MRVELTWVTQQSIMNSNLIDRFPSIAVDANGNSYVSYYTDGTVLGGTNKGANDIVVMKLDNNGSLLWISQQSVMNSTIGDAFPSIAVDNSGNSYISYRTTGTVSSGVASGGVYDIVVCKINTHGIVEWVQQQIVMNTNGGDQDPSIAVDGSGNCYISYRTDRTVLGGTNIGTNDIVVFKMSTDGVFQWIKQQSVMNTTGSDLNPSIDVDNSGNSYVSYYTNGTVLGGTNKGFNDIVVFKLNNDGDLQWIKQEPLMNSADSDDVYPSIAVNRLGELYVSYYTNGTVSGGTNKGSNDIAVFKMDKDGVFQWIKQQSVMNTTGSDLSPSITVDDSGNSYVSYLTRGTVSGGTFLGGTHDIVIFKLNNAGDLQWIKQESAMNTSGNDQNPSIDIDSENNVYVSYFTNGVVSGGTNIGNNDIVVMRLSQIFPLTESPHTVLISAYGTINIRSQGNVEIVV
jgi:6-phosphogluconolactonase (cycloisomerase 2 family)